MRRHYFFPKSEPMPEENAENERRPTGRHVHDRAAREIDGGNFGRRIPEAIHPAIDTPDHVRDRKINREHPGRDENEHGSEFHSLSDGTDDQCRRDNGEH